jgi:hypothetical protein
MHRDEMKSQAKVVDMMLTMHSILASRYRRRAQILEISLIAVSTILLSFTFVDPLVLPYFSLTPDTARILLGVCSILIFILSIVSLVVDWKGVATQHREAFNTLIPLKSEWREMLSTYEDHEESARIEFVRRSALILGHIIPIPDAQFNRLKAEHHRKVMISKLISAHPGSSVHVLRLYLWVRSNRKALTAKLPDEASR